MSQSKWPDVEPDLLLVMYFLWERWALRSRIALDSLAEAWRCRLRSFLLSRVKYFSISKICTRGSSVSAAVMLQLQMDNAANLKSAQKRGPQISQKILTGSNDDYFQDMATVSHAFQPDRNRWHLLCTSDVHQGAPKWVAFVNALY